MVDMNLLANLRHLFNTSRPNETVRYGLWSGTRQDLSRWIAALERQKAEEDQRVALLLHAYTL